VSELIKASEQQVVAVDPMQLLAVAVQQGADIDKLEKLMALQERWEANNARKAFTVAMAKFKESPPKIVKDKEVSFGTTNYKHAELDQVTEKIAAALSAVGISHRFAINQADNKITVHCVLTHALGHSETTSLASAADTSGNKNGIQAIGSAVSYLQRYTLLAATGLATGLEDDDGKGADPVKVIDDKQLSELRDWLASVGRSERKLAEHFKIKSIELLPAKLFDDALAVVRSAAKAAKQ
jgi:ERF superfamily protein